MRLTHSITDVKRKSQVCLKSDTNISDKLIFDRWESMTVQVIDSRRIRMDKASRKAIAFLKSYVEKSLTISTRC